MKKKIFSKKIFFLSFSLFFEFFFFLSSSFAKNQDDSAALHLGKKGAFQYKEEWANGYDDLLYQPIDIEIQSNTGTLRLKNLQKIDPLKLKDLDTHENLQAETLKRLLPEMLNSVSLENRIIDPLYQKNGDCYTIKQSSNNGLNTNQLFFIGICKFCKASSSLHSNDKESKGDEDQIKKCDKNNANLFSDGFIFKGVKSGLKEIAGLHRIAIHKISEFNTNNETLRGEARNKRPLITKNLANFFYPYSSQQPLTPKFDKKELAYFSLLEKAPGKSFHKWLDLYSEAKRTQNQELTLYYKNIIKRMFTKIGSALSYMHQDLKIKSKKYPYLGKTYIHGDFHGENGFYDPETDQFSFIDNETLSLSFGKNNKELGIKDIVDLYSLHSFKTMACLWSPQLTLNIAPKWNITDMEWHSLWMKLLEAYIQAFPEKLRDEHLVEEMEKAFFELMSPPLFKTLIHRDQREMKLLILNNITFPFIGKKMASKRKKILIEYFLKPMFADLKIKYTKQSSKKIKNILKL